MTKPVTIPNTFATATTAIPLSNLDADFSTVATAMNDANTYSNYAADTGSANAYVVTLTGISAIYSAGLRIQFKAGNANTTASTLNVNAQGAKNITYQDASAIASGTIAANSIVDVMYDGTQFLLMNDPAGGTGGDVVGPASATDNAIVRFDGTTGKLVQNSVVTIADSTGDISGVGQLNATTLDATNIEVTNIKAKDGTAAASIADSTGVVSVTANPVLSGGTATGVLYLDGSKVATSGGALTFDGTNSLQVSSGAGKLRLGINTSDQFLDIYRDSGSGASVYNAAQGSNFGFHVWQVASAEQMRLTSTGLGIGTSSPGTKLHVTDTTVGGTPFRITGANSFAYNFRSLSDGSTDGRRFDIQVGSSSGQLSFSNSSVEFARFDSSGNLGIGTSSPGGRLQLNSGAVDCSIRLRTTASGDGAGDGVDITLSTGNLLYITNRENGATVFENNGSERARITSGGDLLVGQTTADQSVQGIIFNSYGTGRFITNGGADNVCLYLNRIASDGAIQKFLRNSTEVGSVSVTTTATAYNTSSDYRLKDNPQPLTNSGAFIDALKPKTWNWKADGSKGVGFIAHEVQEVSPSSVSGEKDGEEMQAMEYGSAEFIANIIAEIQSLRQRVAQLEGA